MSKIISFIITFLNRINKFIWKIIVFLSKFIKLDEINHLDDKPEDVKYRLFHVDEPAIIEPFVKIEHKDFKQLIKINNIKPIKRRNGKDITIDVHCPCCGAPKEYLYDNTGKQTQFECKVCSFIFSTNPNKEKDVILKCPHCRYQLDLYHHREDFDVYRCRNDKCPYYLKNKSSLNAHDKKLYQEHPEKIKLRYIYRKFKLISQLYKRIIAILSNHQLIYLVLILLSMLLVFVLLITLIMAFLIDKRLLYYKTFMKSIFLIRLLKITAKLLLL